MTAGRDRVGAIEVSGQIGPRGDGYRPGAAVDPDEAADYHRPQSQRSPTAGADVATALTLTDTGEALGVVAAARDVGIPVAISFTVETDGKLPTGKSLMEALAVIDAAGGPDYFFVNCAHPEHVERGLGIDGFWRDRVHGLRVNASTRSHAELDAMTELDAGDPALLAAGPRAARALAARRSGSSAAAAAPTRGTSPSSGGTAPSPWSDGVRPRRRAGVPRCSASAPPGPARRRARPRAPRTAEQVRDAQGVTPLAEHAVVRAADGLGLRVRDAVAGEAVALPSRRPSRAITSIGRPDDRRAGRRVTRRAARPSDRGRARRRDGTVTDQEEIQPGR